MNVRGNRVPRPLSARVERHTQQELLVIRRNHETGAVSLDR
jgi:hypothetical protein